jgi:hypothetical protein
MVVLSTAHMPATVSGLVTTLAARRSRLRMASLGAEDEVRTTLGKFN